MQGQMQGQGQMQRADAEDISEDICRGQMQRVDAGADAKGRCRGQLQRHVYRQSHTGSQQMHFPKGRVSVIPSLPSCTSLLMATLAFSMVQTATDSPLQLAIHTVITLTSCIMLPVAIHGVHTGFVKYMLRA